MSNIHTPHRIQTVVIGGGQAGLSVGYHLARRGPSSSFSSRTAIGDSWRQRWDSLRLFTPARFDGLVGMRFPAPSDTFPTKDEMADYSEAYAAHFNLPVQTGVHGRSAMRRGDRYAVSAGDSSSRRTMSSWRCRLPASRGAVLRPRSRSDHRAAALGRLSEPVAASAGGVWWSAPAIPERTLRSKAARGGHRTWIRAGTLATCPSASKDSRDVCCWSDSCSEACSIACSR